MIRTSTVGRGLIVIVAEFLCLAWTQPALAQADVVSMLRQQEQSIKMTIASLQKSQAQLDPQISPALKSAFDEELRNKQASLEGIEDKLKQAGGIEKTITALKTAESTVQGHVSAAFITRLENEVQVKEKALANLVTDNSSPHNTTPMGAQAPTPAAAPHGDPAPAETKMTPLPAAPAAQPNSARGASPSAPAPNGNGQAPPADNSTSQSANAALDAASQASPPSAADQTATANKKPAAPAAAPAPPPAVVLCANNNGQLPCIDQPYAPTKEIIGKAKPGATVTITVNPGGNSKPLGSADVDSSTGVFTKSVGTLGQFDTVEADQTNPIGTSGPVPILPQTNAAKGQSLYTLGMAGIDITSTTTSGPQQQYFAEFDLTTPVKFGKTLGCTDTNGPLDNRCWLWFNPRIASIPTPKTSQLSSLSSASSALSGLGSMTLGDITQSAEFEGGFEYALLKPRRGILFGQTEKASISVSAIAGGGIVTPFNSLTTAQEFDLGTGTGKSFSPNNVVQQFASNPNFASQYPQLAGALKLCPYNSPGTLNCSNSSSPSTQVEHVAFVLPNRSRFYRNWEAGLRFKTFFFNTDCNSANLTKPKECKPLDLFPGVFDVTFGQDETVTAGHLHRFIFGLSSSYPFPGLPWLRIFGSAHIGISGNRYSPALALPPSTAPGIALSDPSVLVQTVNPEDQDYFRLGFGIDIAKAYELFVKKQTQPSAVAAQ